MDWRRLDLNLLKVLAVLLEERSVVRAADRLCLSPSAVSHALARLRRAFDDPLFVRSGSSMTPTARALALEPPLTHLLASVGAQLRPQTPSNRSFDPGQTSRVVKLASPGALELTLVPALASALRRLAPNWSLVVEPFERRSYGADLATGRLDVVFAIGGHTSVDDGVRSDAIWTDELVVVVGPGSRLHGRSGALSIQEYLNEPQVYPLPWTLSQNYLDVELGRSGRHRKLLLRVPSYAAVGAVLASSDLIASMPDRTAAALVRSWPQLKLLRIEPARYSELTLLWSRSGESDPALAWLRSIIKEVSRETISGLEGEPVPNSRL